MNDQDNDQILQAKIIRIVRQKVRRITNEI